MTKWTPHHTAHRLAMILVGLLLGSTASVSLTAITTTKDHPTATSGLRQVRDIKQFDVSVPVDWDRYSPQMGLSPEEKGVFDVVMIGPSSIEGRHSEISIAYYAPGNLIHKTSERFLQLHSKPVFGSPSPGEVYGDVKEERIRGRLTWVFERDKFEYQQPERLNPKKIPIHERFVVISARNGFYVLRSSAGLDRKAMVLALFEAVLASFTPLVD